MPNVSRAGWMMWVLLWMACMHGWQTEVLLGQSKRPNIVMIVADDLGVGELGCYGQKRIRTPRLDALAKQGLRLTQFYAGNNVCAPSRCCLMTGKHAGHATIRDNANPTGLEDLKKRYGWEFPGQIPIPESEVTLPGVLHAQGYTCAGFGKWGLGHVGTTGDPHRHGFDHFYGYYCQVHAHNHYPKFLWRDDQKELLAGNSATLSGEVYSQDRFVAEAIAFMEGVKDRPFFLYLPFVVPHLSIQVPDEELDAYAGVIEEAEYEHKSYLKHPRPRAGYAGMVSRMDRGIGEILDTLERQHLSENTLVIFTSDNGPTYDRLGGTDSEYFESAAGLRGYKGSMFEGGIRVPCVVRYPGVLEAGRESDVPHAYWDLMPTILETVGIPQPDGDGLSHLGVWRGEVAKAPHEFLYWESPGYGGQQAVRMGEWKGVRQKMHAAKKRGESISTELYHLASDPSETRNVAAEHGEVLQKIEAIMAREHVKSLLFPFPAIDTQE